VGHELRPQAAAPRQATPQRGEHARSNRRIKPARGIDRREHVGLGCASFVDVELEGFAGADQVVPIAVEPHPVLLEPVAQPGLGDPTTGLELMAQPQQVAVQIGVYRGEEGGRDGTEQQPAESRLGRSGEHGDAHRHPAGGGDRPGVEDLQFGEQHPDTLSATPSG
jgi:hypothetical protein